MNFFSSEPFLHVIADVWYPGRDRALEDVRVGNEVFRLLVIGGKLVITSCPFLDYLEPHAPPERSAAREHTYIPRAVRAVVPASEYAAVAARFEPSPFIDWDAFASWDAFLAHVHARSPYPFKVTERKRRRIERELGPLRLCDHEADPELLAICMRWKSQQYVRTGLWDLFAAERPRRLFAEMHARGLLTISSLRAGDRPLAIHAGVVHGGRFYYWLPAHDPELGSYSPGTLLLEHLIATSFRQRLVFDFLIGNEPYKWTFATHTRLIGEAGEPPVRLRLARSVRALTAAHLRRQPQLYAWLRAVKRRLLAAEIVR